MKIYKILPIVLTAYRVAAVKKQTATLSRFNFLATFTV